MPEVNYDPLYRERRRLCGDPYPEVRRFFHGYAVPRAAVLDLGCGQGRDALMAARLGHRVLGVDLSAVGVSQMLEEAAAEGLRVQGYACDVVTFRSHRRFDVVLLDRVLHLLPTNADRLAMLCRLRTLTAAGSFVLIADTASHRSLIRGFFEGRPDVWRVECCHSDFICVQRLTVARRRAQTQREPRPRSGARRAARAAG